jgi:hypothetical protein
MKWRHRPNYMDKTNFTTILMWDRPHPPFSSARSLPWGEAWFSMDPKGEGYHITYSDTGAMKIKTNTIVIRLEHDLIVVTIREHCSNFCSRSNSWLITRHYKYFSDSPLNVPNIDITIYSISLFLLSYFQSIWKMQT